MYAYIVLYSFIHSSYGYRSLPYTLGNKSVWPNTFFPNSLFLKVVTVRSFSFSIRPFFIDTKTIVLIASLAMFSRDFPMTKYLSGPLVSYQAYYCRTEVCLSQYSLGCESFSRCFWFGFLIINRFCFKIKFIVQRNKIFFKPKKKSEST